MPSAPPVIAATRPDKRMRWPPLLASGERSRSGGEVREISAARQPRRGATRTMVASVEDRERGYPESLRRSGILRGLLESGALWLGLDDGGRASELHGAAARGHRASRARPRVQR